MSKNTLFCQCAKSLLCLAIAASTSIAHANRIAQTSQPTQMSDYLSKFSGVNQLGELSLNIPQSQYFSTDDGVPVVFTAMHHLPIVDISLGFDAGSGHDELIRRGADGEIAMMVSAMMTQGTKTLDEEAFYEKADQLAMSLSSSVERESFDIDLRIIKDGTQLDEAVDLMLDAYRNPRFDEKILARNKARLKVAYQANEASPKFLATRAFNGIMEQNNPHAYDDDIKKIDLLSQDELFAFVDRFLVVQNAKLAITGDLTLEEAKTLANRISRGLKNGKKAEKVKAHQAPTPIHHHIDYPSTQTQIIIGGIAPAVPINQQAIRQYSDFVMGNAVLAGGDFNARLTQAIRVKKGYTYGISGSLSYNDQRSVYSIGFSTKNEEATAAINDTLATIDEVLSSGITQRELDLEKAGTKNAYPARFANHAGVHDAISATFFGGYPKDHLHTRFERIDRATLDSVNAALRHFIIPNNFVIVTVGAIKPTIILPKDN
ncbi:M16 family metallopeptidase [Moraxella nasicaprae]|uniref:Insulinase family protein n=1 Tax=Moraxella nasicaprae TaxID=2904122 RepID=A0ABY6F4Y3_9GAMM|nr:pitrilysin family protein [Moraxella nasicaprae]UXZ04955.1 insulinase family protein [Moraxella nasicaprae]